MKGNKRRPLVWSFKAGRCYRNRVSVFAREGWSIIMMTWNGGQCSLRHGDRPRAKLAAMEKAAELARAKPTHRTTDVLIAMRNDLARVGKLQGLPDGVAPSRAFYGTNGRFGQHNIRSAFKGWRGNVNTKGGNPADQWGRAIERFGFKTITATQMPTYALCAADVRRVALGLNRPGIMPSVAAYRKLGAYTDETVRKHLRAKRWEDVARVLHLEMSEGRRTAGSEMQRKLGRVPTNSERRAA